MSRKHLIPFSLTVMMASTSVAGTIIANTCSYSDVNAAYNTATAGDTISIPSGDCTWSNTLTIAKTDLIISGAGKSSTIIRRNGNSIFRFSGTSGNRSRITSIGFEDCAACVYFSGNESAKDFRIDHNEFTSTYATIQTNGTVRGLVDNNTFRNSYAFYLFANGNSSTRYPLTVGDAISSTTNTLFIEDNLFTDMGSCSNVPHSIVGNMAARAIIRYNTFDYESGACGWADAIDAHDSLENWPNRGTLGYEIYENDFLMDSNNGRTIHLRGGQHMVYNNRFNKNLQTPIKITSYLYGDTPGRCNGNIYDDDDSSANSCPDQINHTYIWDNTNGNGSIITPDVGASAVVKQDIHYFLKAKAGYTGYTYPHPLQSGIIPPPVDAPTPKSPTWQD